MNVPVSARITHVKLAQLRDILLKHDHTPLNSASRKHIVNRLLGLQQTVTELRYLALCKLGIPAKFAGTLTRNTMIPISSRQFLSPKFEFYTFELKTFEWVSFLLGLPKVKNLTFMEDIVETANSIWTVSDISKQFPNVFEGETHAHEPLTRTIIIQSLTPSGLTKSSVEIIADLIYETALIDLYYNYRAHYWGASGERVALIQVQLFLNIASVFLENLNRFQPYNRVVTPEHDLRLVNEGNMAVKDEFIRLQNINSAQIAKCNTVFGLVPGDVNLYI